MTHLRLGLISGILCGLFFCAGYFTGLYNSTPPDSAALQGLPAQLPTDPIQLGKVLYSSLCIACHQPSGMGVARQIPPLVGSEWVLGSEARLKRVVLNGMSGPLHVQGMYFNNTMPPLADRWDDQKIAAVLTFIRHNWGNNAPPISAASVAATRAITGQNFALWTEVQLQQLHGDDLPAATQPTTPSKPPAPTTH